MRTALPLLAPAAALLASTGCVIYADDVEPPPPPANYAPFVEGAEAGCFYDSYYRDDVWYFEAFTDDPNGVYDVVEVWADVYDEYHGATYIESFELYPTNDPHVWFSDWLGHSTWLDCHYDGYTVDFVAYDSYGDYDVVTVWALSGY